jgi:tetratricopeptide (TPR) repeat protein
VTSPTEAARAALASRAFDDAHALLADAAPTDETLELRADANYGAGRYEAALHDREQLYTRQLREGREADAAATAAGIALYLLVDTGLMSSVRGWVARSERLLEDEDAPARAVLAAVSTYERLLCGDADGAAAHAATAVALGDRHDVPIARFLGRIAIARLAAVDGRLDEGMAVLDEVAVELMSGEYGPFLIGNLYCELVCAAQALMLVDRAREWTAVVDQWRHGVAFGTMHGRCRVHRAELLRVSGPADAAEQEALAACTELRPWMRREFGWPLVELGNTRLRRGDLAGAEDAFLRAHEHAWPPLPGLALLRMEQGEPTAAAELIAAEIAHPTVLPWKERPPIADLQLIPLLEAQVEIAGATGDLDVAGTAAARLRQAAERFATPGVRASADLATARVALAAGDPDAATTAAAAAVAAWVELAAPYDAATARVVLGRAQDMGGNRERARIEWRCARDAFAEYGAPRRVAEVERLLGGTDAPERSRTAVLAREGDGWRVGLAGREVVLADLKGIRLLGRLVAAPGRPFHVLDLAGAGVVEQGIPALDEEAKAVYRLRLAEADEDVAEAERNHDEARRALAERDRDYLLEELRRASGLGGRTRMVGGTAERARTSVTRTLRYAIGRIGDELPDLGEHLAAAVHTGVECSYAPDPLSRVSWRLEGQ